MQCPACRVELNRTTYEGVPVFECPRCGGYLVGRRQMVLIKSSRGKSREELEADVESRSGGDSTEDVRCPKCLARDMKKQRVPAGDESFHVDVCEKCGVVWFEGGELARMQLQYEASAKGVESLARQQRAAGLDAGDNEFQRNLAALPRNSNPFVQALKEAWLLVATVVLLVGSAAFAMFGHHVLAAVVSVPGVVLLAVLAIPTFGSNLGRWIMLAAVAAGEAGFLAWLFL
jgi:Zn-finger nucleic acid-binding protein